ERVPTSEAVGIVVGPASGATASLTSTQQGEVASAADGTKPPVDEDRSEAPASPTLADERAGPHSQFTARTTAHFRTVAGLGVQAAEALEHAHQEGVVHRDVKPSNLLLDARGKLWVTDFGLARFQHDSTLTASGDLLGTLRYMSPEQTQA